MPVLTVRKLMAAAALSVCVLSAQALPSLEAVPAEAQKGHNAQAQTLMEKVVVPAVVAPAAVAPEPSPHVPGWVWFAGLLAVAGLVWSVLHRPNTETAFARVAVPAPIPIAATASISTPPSAATDSASAVHRCTDQDHGHGPGTAPRQGSGLLGLGLAAAGGVAAGMLAERLLSSGIHESAADSTAPDSGEALVPALFDDAGDQPLATAAIEEDPIDFGSGDDWGGDLSMDGLDDW